MSRLALLLVFSMVLGCSSTPVPPTDGGVPTGLDAGLDAGMTVATQSVGAMGGVLEIDGLRLALPEGALTSAVALRVERTSEQPTLTGVTPLTPVFSFGPEGTQFADGVSVTFALATPAASGEVPVVYWSQPDGTWSPLPTWWDTDGRVHAVTTHFSKAFVGLAATAPNTLLCCRDVPCTGGRGVCLLREPAASGKLFRDGETWVAGGVQVRLTTTATPNTPRGLEQRATPVRPLDEGLRSAGTVVDLSVLPFAAGEVAQVCAEVKSGTPIEGTCLGYFDETQARWKCEDPCLKASSADGGSRDLLCGDTSHFTSFAVLLSGGKSNSECGR